MTPFFLLQQITYRILIEFTIACWIALRLCLKLLITLGLTLRSYSKFVECHFTFIQFHTKKTSRTTSPVASSSIHSLLKRMFTWTALDSRASFPFRIIWKYFRGNSTNIFEIKRETSHVYVYRLKNRKILFQAWKNYSWH